MIASGEISVLILEIEGMAKEADTANKWLYIDILKKIRRTRDKVASDEIELARAVRCLAEYHKIEAGGL